MLQALINKYLHLDPARQPQLLALEAKTFSVSCSSGIKLQLYWTFNNGVLLSSSNKPDRIDVGINSTLEGYLKFLLLKQPQEISISGDAALANALQKIFSNIDIDWEEELSKYSGDIIAVQIAQAIKKVSAYQYATKQAMLEMIGEYLQEESGLLPTAFEVNEFIEQVDALRLRVDRCEAKIKSHENN